MNTEELYKQYTQLLRGAPDDVVQFLVNASFEITRAKKKAK